VFERFAIPAGEVDDGARSFIESGKTKPLITNNASAKVDMERLAKVVDAHFADTRLHARAVLLVVDGEIVLERYGDGCDESTRLLGWSATKTILNALIGIRIKQGHMSLATTAGELIPSWKRGGQSDERVAALANTTVEQMLRMSDGFNLDEFYIPRCSAECYLPRYSAECYIPRYSAECYIPRVLYTQVQCSVLHTQVQCRVLPRYSAECYLLRYSAACYIPRYSAECYLPRYSAECYIPRYSAVCYLLTCSAECYLLTCSAQLHPRLQ
jgi:hypothetical protein